jgi:hypothetical protein
MKSWSSSTTFPRYQRSCARAELWSALKRWERRELGQELRRVGLSYNEISRIIPVHDGTLSSWCRDIELTEEQRARLAKKRPALAVRLAVGQQLRRAARARHASFVDAGRTEARFLSANPLFVAGVVAYWSEGAKSREVCFSNSDPDLIRLFIHWAREFLSAQPLRFGARMHLHAGQDEDERKAFWSGVTEIPPTRFGKSFIKAEGSGHRKKELYNGTIQIRLNKSRNDIERVRGWIDGIRDLSTF